MGLFLDLLLAAPSSKNIDFWVSKPQRVYFGSVCHIQTESNTKTPFISDTCKKHSRQWKNIFLSFCKKCNGSDYNGFCYHRDRKACTD